ncbi:MAG TPA: hypothetical protein VER12_08530 [Polyangiaceae bacterium]|nr:hypothetical protein [Polyangiaceae bacterium]HYQ27942.1 hypothetical protein [Polyangiaceae bacterium]
MRHRLYPVALFASLLGLTGVAEAEAVAGKPSELRRDPRGTKGISPFGEAIKRGDTALVAHDVEAALAAYRDALGKEPDNAFAYYRIGEVQLLKGDLHEAELAFAAGLRTVAADRVALKAKLQFALADLRERQKAYDDASARWTEYEAFATAKALPFSASGAERKKVVEGWRKLSADSVQVKARIEKGTQAADEAVRKSAK